MRIQALEGLGFRDTTANLISEGIGFREKLAHNPGGGVRTADLN